MTIEGVDYSFAPPSAAGLAAAGKRFAMRYVGPGSQAKRLSAAERDSLRNAGLSIVLLAEGGVVDALHGTSVGVSHARLAQQEADRLGLGGLPIYFAVDFDATAAQWPAVAAYLRGAGSVIGAGRVGVYGGIRAIQWAQRDQLAAWFFQTYAWSGGVWANGVHVQQYRNGQPLGGGTVDLCRAMTTDYGQWPRPQVPNTEENAMGAFIGLTDGPVRDGIYYSNFGTIRWMPTIAAIEDIVRRGGGTWNGRTQWTGSRADAAAVFGVLVDDLRGRDGAPGPKGDPGAPGKDGVTAAHTHDVTGTTGPAKTP